MKNFFRQTAWHEYGHTISSPTGDIPCQTQTTKQIPFMDFVRCFSEFWADYMVKSKLLLTPTHYVNLKFEAIKDVLQSPLDDQNLNIFKLEKAKQNTQITNLFYLLFQSPSFYIHGKWSHLIPIFREVKQDACLKLLHWINQQFHEILMEKSERINEAITQITHYLDELDYRKIIL